MITPNDINADRIIGESININGRIFIKKKKRKKVVYVPLRVQRGN